MVTTEERTSIATLPAYPVISWGAVFAGLAVLVAGSVLLLLLGIALGFSILDLTDLEALGRGLSIGAALWVLLTTLVVFFVGGLLAAHLSGGLTQASGLMHGTTVWAIGILMMLALDAIAARAFVQTTAGAASGLMSVTSSLGGKVWNGIQVAGASAINIAGSPYADELRAQIKREAARVLSETDAPGGASVTPTEVRAAIENIEPEVLEAVASEIIAGDLDSARSSLAESLGLSQAQVTEIVNGVSERVTAAVDQSEAAQQVEQWLSEQLDQALQTASAMSGPAVSPRELREALNELDLDLTLSAATALMTGDPQAAKDSLVANTSLTDREVNSIVDGVTASIEREGNSLINRVNENVESISDYVQMLLWLYFITASLSLGAAALGGYIGANEGGRTVRTVTRRITA